MNHLARIRELRGLNQRQLGEMIGRDQSTIQRAETGHPSAKLATYVACAEALGVTLADLFAADMTPIERQLVTIFRSVPPEKHAQLLQVLELAATLPASKGE